MESNIFNSWNEEKQRINSLTRVEKYPKIREIWHTKMELNIGDEQNGKEKFQRPVLILKKIGSLFFCIALSTKNKKSFFYKKLEEAIFYKGYSVENSVVIISQGKIYDKKRFIKQIGYISQNEFGEIQKELRNIYF